ncbi:MAG: hypothetical protein ICV64_11630 [Thermoleophilia bacterium]|nr:hypothetical protein [Thermoleophilia bacterium]
MAGELEHGLEGLSETVERALVIVRELERGEAGGSARVREAMAALDEAAARLRAWQEAESVAEGPSPREGGPPPLAA